MARDRGGIAPEEAGFAQALAALKREGSNILLVGAETGDAHGAVCHQLLGETGSGPRYRLFVTDERTRVSTTEAASGETMATTRTIDYGNLTVDGTGNDDLSGRTPLGTLGIEVVEAVDAFDDDADGLEASELRLCVDSLVPLLEEHTTERVFRVLHMTTSRVAHVNGMGHYHLPLERDHDAVNLFEPLFDAIVEVRIRDGTHEHRWELRDRELTTEWIPFSERFESH